MDLSDFISDTDRRASLAKAVGTSSDYLWQVATSWQGRKAGPAMARKISEATHGLVALSDLRPDIWPKPEAA